MYYAVTFVKGTTRKNSLADWYMVPSSRPAIKPPKAKKNLIDIPGSNNRIDLTESLSGDVTYENREGSIEFIVFNEKPVSWQTLYDDIMNTIQGQRVQLFLEEDPESNTLPDWYYEGRVEVNEWKTNKDFSRITIDYDLDPFKYKNPAVTDTFRLSATATKTYVNNRMPVVPTITVNEGTGITVTYKGTPYTLSTGSQTIAGILFEANSSNTLIFTGNGNITVSYIEGKL